MLKKLLKLSVALSLLILISASGVHASGKMEVNLGEKVMLQAEDMTGGSFKWVAKKGKDIMSTQETSIFNYTFDQQGEYNINLTITDKAGNTKNTTVMVLVGQRYSVPSANGGAAPGGTLGGGGLVNVPLKVNYETLPVQTGQRTVHILGDEGRVVYDIGTRDDILEYRVDRNIYLDSDGNGIANDDIDNADDSSYLLGGIWQTTYLATESSKIAAEITVVDKLGQKAKTQVEIVFDSVPAKSGNVVAALDTLPALDAEKKRILLYDAKDTVAFYAERSQGDIAEYRIDKNIFVDSDGDGNPSNDIDNRNDASFKTGDVWTTTYDKTDQQIIAQLIVVSKAGGGSRIQREIAFTDKPIAPISTAQGGTGGATDGASEVTGTENAIRLTSDKEFVQKGDPIAFKVEGLTQSMDNYTFDWDFNGDGTVDQTVEGVNTVSYIFDAPGVSPVKVHVKDKDNNEANFQLDMLVKDTQKTIADFDFTVDGKIVTFTNLSAASSNLANKTLTYTWSFGDTDSANFEAQKDKIGTQNPVYTYTVAGTHVVTLTVADADLVTSTKTKDIVIEAVAGETPAENVDGTTAPVGTSGKSFIGAMFKVILYIILGIILLVVFIVLGLLVFLKIQHPDLIFEELVDELKIKILGILGIQDLIEPSSASAPIITSQTPLASSYEASARAKPAPDKAKKTAEPEPAPDKGKASERDDEQSSPPKMQESVISEAPVPDWLKNTTPAAVTPTAKPEVIEGEVVEESKTQDQGPKQDDSSTPDWLKNA